MSEDRIPGIVVALEPDADPDDLVAELRRRDDVRAAAKMLNGLRASEAEDR